MSCKLARGTLANSRKENARVSASAMSSHSLPPTVADFIGPRVDGARMRTIIPPLGTLHHDSVAFAVLQSCPAAAALQDSGTVKLRCTSDPAGDTFAKYDTVPANYKRTTVVACYKRTTRVENQHDCLHCFCLASRPVALRSEINQMLGIYSAAP